ncbi:hypothetical protein HYH03_003300 [Edaphochlamys debaryana]|uniref:Chlorophyll a-b binding protein, chloroplastic n=1 Tax=Edaphochlamys debaryana TaxID=47281 RepID=A0A836C4A4_9CHLO|nr:hypothetical protein HYH03_003300 [Edaphochlamys debaryana]|eukprot:KAG2498549.1 hypothetical protein HYH03_003300 [Edaphochlamys debaryana]
MALTMRMLNGKSSVVAGASLPASRRAVIARVGKTMSGKEVPPAPEASAGDEVYEYLKSCPGVSAPFENVFDPAGLARTSNLRDIKRWRESEITHGRVSMLAALGFIVGEQLQDFPLFFNFDGRVQGPAIYHFQQIGQGFWEPLLIAIGVAESYRVAVGWATPTGTGFNALKDEYEPGYLGFDPLNLLPEDPAARKELQTKEINNGRLAMIAIAAFVAQELVEQTEIFEHLFLRFEKEAILELDDIERDIGLPITPLPEELKNL